MRTRAAQRSLSMPMRAGKMRASLRRVASNDSLEPHDAKRRAVSNASQMFAAYLAWMRCELSNPVRKRTPTLQVRNVYLPTEEVTHLCNCCRFGAEEILMQWLTQHNVTSLSPHDVHAACSLASKLILGVDAEEFLHRYYKNVPDSAYSAWILQFLSKQGDWIPCRNMH